jgi:hypothetical protein
MGKKVKLKNIRGRTNPTSKFGHFRQRSWWTFTEKRKEMVAPYINSYDSGRISSQVRDKVKADAERYYNSDVDPHRNSKLFGESMAHNLLPDHLIMDIYNLYYRCSADHEYAVLDDTNKGKWKLLESVNDSSLKIVTNQSTINTTIFVTEICRAILKGACSQLDKQQRNQVIKMMDKVEAKQEEADDDDEDSRDDNEGDNGTKSEQDSSGDNNKDGEKSEDSQSGDGNSQPQDSSGSEGESGDSKQDQHSGDGSRDSSGDSEGREDNQESDSTGDNSSGSTDFEKLIERIVNSNEFDQNLSDAKKNAFTRISKFEQAGITTKELEDLGGQQALHLIEKMDIIGREISSINSSLPRLKSVIEKIVDKSTSYFSSAYKTQDLSIFESDTIDELDGVEYFHPKLRKTHLDEIITREHKYKGKINVYIDISSSMNGGCEFGGATISKILFAKALVVKMMELNLVDKVIPFGSYLREPYDPPNPVTISLMIAKCGTSINRVIEDCEKRQENGIVVTDCEDGITVYSDRCFILGTSDARLNLHGEARAFARNNQVWVFDRKGNEILEL